MNNVIYFMLFLLLVTGITVQIESDFLTNMNERPNHNGSFSADTLIEMERTICYGTCPSYTLTIHGDGKVIFNGKEFVEHKGMAESEISKDKLDELIRISEEIDFMNIPSNPECQSWMTDHPSVFLTVQIDDSRNSVTHYQGCKGFEHEDELYKFEEAIDSLSGAKRWIEGDY